MYQSGVATSADDLLTKIKDFAVAQGWTLNSFAVLGTGHRLHLQKGSLYLNMRSYLNTSTNDIAPNIGTATIYGIMANLSTGYNGANNWEEQPGTAVWVVSSNNQSMAGGMTGLNSSSINYHFFSFSSPAEALYIICEYPAGIYQFILAGQLVKLGAWDGGAFLSGSVGPDTSTIQSVTNAFGLNINASTPFGMLRVENLDTYTGYATARNYTGYPSPRAIDSVYYFRASFEDAPNAFNSLAPLEPISVFVTRTGGISPSVGYDESSDPLSELGYLPNIYAVSMLSLVAAGNYPINLSPDQYRVFPCTAINSTASLSSSANPPHSRNFGFAIKSN